MARYPLLLVAVAFAAGIGAAPYFYLTAREQIWMLTLVCATAVWLIWIGRRRMGLAACWGGFFLCGTFWAAAEHHHLPPHHLNRLENHGLFRPQQPVELIGWARTPSTRRPGSETFDLEVEEIRQAGRTLPASGGVRIYYFQSSDRPPTLGVRYGTRLRVRLEDLRRPRNFLTPDSFDWQAYMRRQGIVFTGLVRQTEELEVLPGRAGSRWRAALYRLRARFLDNLDRLYGAEQAAILKAMLLGDDNWLSQPVESVFQASGTYHILVVSGWNVFVLAVPLLWITARLRFPEWLGALFVAAAVVAFALLAEGGAAVSRAALMFLVYLLARFFYRQRAALNSIAAAALILLVVNPSDLRDAGFQLSFFAVLVLAAVAVPLIEWIAAPYRTALRGIDDRQQDFLLEPRQVQFRSDIRVLLDLLSGPPGDPAASVWLRAALRGTASGALAVFEALLFTGLIQVGMFLATVAYFQRITWSGVLANLAVLPMASSIVVIGLPLLLLTVVWWGAAEWVAVVLSWAVASLKWVVESAAQLQLLNRRVPAPPAWLAVLFLLVLLLLAILVARRSRWTWTAGAALAALCFILSVAPYAPRLSPQNLEVAVLDVGQGDSIFVSYPDGTTMLVDGGGAIPIPGSPPPRMDVGESVISTYLWSRNIQQLDYVVLTHYHWDHMGGLKAILENFRVGELWRPRDPQDRGMSWLHLLAAARGTRDLQVSEGLRQIIRGVRVEVLSPPTDWAPRRATNNDSVVLRLGWRGRNILLPGDAESRMERRLVESGEPLAADVLKVAHHGSRSSSTAAFLAAASPQFGIISVGAFKRFDHPHQEVLEALQSSGVRVYRTDIEGTTTITTDGHRIGIQTHRATLRPWPRFAP